MKLSKKFESLFPRYQIWLETSVKGTDSIFDHVKLFYYRCQKINFNLDGPYVGSPDWIKVKKEQ